MTADGSLACPPRALSVSPLWLDGCFGALHVGRTQASASLAVLICPPVAWDAMYAHHSLRLLADRLALLGYPTLRFNYPSTGDSADLEAPHAEHWSAWQHSVSKAIDWLKAATGAERVVLAGLRLGGTVAAILSQARTDVAGLILMAPVLRGHSYMRQLSIEAQMENGQTGSLADGLEFLELSFSPETVRLINQVDLRQARLPAGLKVALFQQGRSRPVDQCVAAWSAAGVDVSLAAFDGLEAMLLQTLEGDPPPLDPTPVTDWLCRAFPVVDLAQNPIIFAPDVLRGPNFTEAAHCFADGGRLCGILCQPLGRATERVVLILNTGREPHQGIARFGVRLARQFAAAGIASFRFDFAGLGDSVGLEGQETILGPLFSNERAVDITAAIDAMAMQGFSRFAVHGLCSGAYHAFHGALADWRIDTVLMVNFPVFQWENSRLLLTPKHYLIRLVKSETWRKVWRGERKVMPILYAQYARLKQRFGQPATATLRSFPVRAMHMLESRGVRTLFLFGQGDRGLAAMDEAFDQDRSGLKPFPSAAFHIVPGLDHVLTAQRMQTLAGDIMIRHLAMVPDVMPYSPPDPGLAQVGHLPAQATRAEVLSSQAGVAA